MRWLCALLIGCATTARPEPLPHPEPPPTTRTPPEPPASAEQCDRLLEHLIDLEVAATGTALDPDARRDHIEARREMFHSICGTTSAARIDCALRAADLDGVEKCDRAP